MTLPTLSIGGFRKMKRVSLFRIAKAISFLLLLCLMFSYVSNVLVNPELNTDLRHYQYVRGFFEESMDSLDAVFIGASNVYSSWVAPIAWEKYGLCVWGMASAGLGGDSFKAITKNIHAVQPNALYVVCMNSFLNKTTVEPIHYYSDYWPTKYKPELLFDLYSEGAIGTSDALELAVPLTRFHDRWTKLKNEDFHHEFNGVKGGNIYQHFLADITDVSDNFYITDKKEELDADLLIVLTDFLSFCKNSDIRILFVGIPWALPESYKVRLNYVSDMIAAEGFPVINLSDHIEDIKLDPKQDYYNAAHTNIHGALKITDYISQYLLAHYDFPEKSGGYYDRWDEAYDRYKEIIAPYLTEEELSQLP